LVLNVSVELLSWTAGACPVPVSAMVCGEPLALSAMLRLAEKVPAADGANVTAMLQLEPEANTVPQVFVWLKLLAFVPEKPMELMASAAVPLLVNVTLWAALVVPAATAKPSVD